jgi:outer membrane protein assembly factor BamB
MVLVAWSTVAVAGDGVDWAYWRGPNGNGISPERSWRSEAVAGKPKILWQKTLGNGWSAVSVKGDRAYTMGNINEEDIVYCLDANTGREKWRHVYACDDGNYSGPRATPVIDDGSVYTLSRAGHVFCLDAVTGIVKWRRDVVEDLGAKILRWGLASSPVVADGNVLLNVGRRGMALDKKTGQTVWDSGPALGNYAALVPARVAGKPTILTFGEKAIYGVDPANGRERWSVEWITKYDINAADPLPMGDKVWISSGYGRGCALLDCSTSRPKIVWENKNVCAHFSSPILHDGYIYAINGNTGRKCQLVCQVPKTGKVAWSKEVGFASMILAGDRLIVFNEKGTLRVVAASPKGYRELARADNLLPPKCWTAPTLSRSRLYLRNSKGSVVCLDLK